jgi:undecaprenyl-diphosphatase
VGGLATLLVLGVIQGLTEFLPLSSSAHLVFAQALLGISEQSLAVDVALHLGTLVAVLLVFRRDVARMLAELARGSGREVLLLVVATLPAAVVGLAFEDEIEELFERPVFAAVGLLVTAGLLCAGEWGRRRRTSEEQLERIPFGTALAIGCMQALAICPGISRSGSTIATALFLGVRPDRAARFSFLLSIPAVLGAVVLQLPDVDAAQLPGGASGLALGAVVAGVVGWISLRWLLAFVSRGAFAWFALYCACAGTIGLFVLRAA